MSRPREPIELILAKGKKHLTKAEIAERKSCEIQPITDNIIPPDYLSKKQKGEFDRISAQLKKLNILGETDVDTLARYIMSRDLYVKLTKQIQKNSVLSDPVMLNKYMINQDRAYRQCDTAAKALGLTISSRCKLVVPKSDQEQPKTNKFAQFEKRRVVNE